MEVNRMNVLFQCDDSFVPYTGVAMTSLLENNRSVRALHLYLVGEGIREENREKLTALAESYGRELTFLDMSSISRRLEALGVRKWGGSYAAFGRLFAPGLIQEELDRLLYLDSDTIVTEDLSWLYNIDLEGNICAMVQDPAEWKLYRQIGHSREEPYFNSGVVLFDVARWKALSCKATLGAFLASLGAQLYFPDQDALNYCLKGRVRRLSARCSFPVIMLTTGIDEYYYLFSLDKKPHFYSRAEMVRASESAAIYHYCSPVKPWLRDTHCAKAELWDSYLRLSPWAGMDKPERGRQTLSVRAMEAVDEYACLAVRKLVRRVYVNVLVPLELWLRKRRAAQRTGDPHGAGKAARQGF